MLTTFGTASGAPRLTGQCKRPKTKANDKNKCKRGEERGAFGQRPKSKARDNCKRQEARNKCKRQNSQRKKTRDKCKRAEEKGAFGAWGGVRLRTFGYPTQGYPAGIPGRDVPYQKLAPGRWGPLKGEFGTLVGWSSGETFCAQRAGGGLWKYNTSGILWSSQQKGSAPVWFSFGLFHSELLVGACHGGVQLSLVLSQLDVRGVRGIDVYICIYICLWCCRYIYVYICLCCCLGGSLYIWGSLYINI